MAKEIDQREKDIQALCTAILDVTPGYYDNPNGANETTCPFCGEGVYESGYDHTPMSGIEHKPDCAYLIAKDLSTGH